MNKKLSIIFTVLFTNLLSLFNTNILAQVDFQTESSSYVENIESSILLLSDHDSEMHNGVNSVFGSAYELLNQAEHSILIANYVYENATILQILNRKAAEGLDVIVVYDRERSKNLPQQLHPSITNLTRLTGDGHMHHKFIVVDRKFNWISSANFNAPKDKNLALVCQDSEIAEILYQESYYIHSQQNRKNAKPFASTIDGQSIELYLLPYNDPKRQKAVETEMNEIGKQKLLQLIKEAKKTIRVSMVVWTFKDSARALVEAKQRGIHVEVVGASIDPEVFKILQQGKISTRRVTNAPFHHKWMLIDDQILWNGSANWSMNAFSRTDDSVTVLYDLKPEQVELMEEAWQELLKISY